ncbi:MAG: gliding motility-associated C-terminal domain-containing protein [Bacteroidetes bacterium]|nr:gliding motility-associated C-terminal domain-containing protein [Bacteroidota bacterium]
MMRFPISTLLCCVLIAVADTNAQTTTCPANIDFEQGNFTNWLCYTGTCCAINTPTAGVVAGRHTITSGTATDPYGGFPIVSPSGNYSLKLGNNSVGSQAERAKYYVHVPAGVNNYSLVFRYAVVFQDPSHAAADQPRFEVKAYDSITNGIVNCSQYTYVANSNLPGFSLSGTGSNVWYKPWTTTTINLSGYAGRTVVIDFASGDCALGAHFGYGYIDLDCGLFKINTVACASSPYTTLTAPPGFQSYIWKDSTLTTTIDTGRTVSITTPSSTRKYAVILIPYTGFGCPDTLFTTVTVSNINLNARDTSICIGTSAPISANATGTGTPYTYSWSPSTALSCTTCANPITSTTTNRRYFVSVTNTDGCVKLDTLNVTVSNIALSAAKQNISCNGTANGSITVSASGGLSPYTYLWNTTPAQTSTTASNLIPGIYSVTVKDNIGCTKSIADTITQPTVLALSKTNVTHVSCFGGNNGSITVTASGGTAPYKYNWSRSASDTFGTISNLVAGTYILTVTDKNGCVAYDTTIITQPTALSSSTTKTDVSCFSGNNGTASVTASGGTTPYTYVWNTSPVKATSAITQLIAGTYIVTITDSKGCIKNDTAIINQPLPIALTDSTANEKCFGDNNGYAKVTASGGTTPYTYSWNTSPVQTTQSISGLYSGTYVVTVTDSHNCVAKDTISISQPIKLTTIRSKTDISCFGGNNGTVGVTVSGGVSGYSYIWNTTPINTNPVVTGLPIGTYIVVTKDANNCTISDTITLTQPSKLTSAITNSNTKCFGSADGWSKVQAAGGTPGYTYNWNTSPAQTTDTAKNLTAGIYIVTITDSKGCTTIDSTIITQPSKLLAAKAKTDVNCYNGNNGTAAIAISGGTPGYTYSWNTSPVTTTPNVTGLSAGVYIVTATDANNCIVHDTITINQPLKLNTSFANANVSCNSGNNGWSKIIASGGSPGYTYSWNTNPAQTSDTAKNLTAGVYIVTITDSKGCTQTDTTTISQPTKLASTKTKSDVACFNGNNGAAGVTISGGTPGYTYSWNTTPLKTTAAITGLQAGIYIVTAKDTNNCTLFDTVTITQPTKLTASHTGNDVSCYNGNNGWGKVIVAGGSPGYTYTWNTTPAQTSDTAKGLTAGIYIVTATDSHGCTIKDTTIITQPAQLAVTATKHNLNCFNDSTGSINVSTTGGTIPYHYSWNTSPVKTSTTINTLTAGIYILTVVDEKGCTVLDTSIITQPALLTASISHADVLCFDGNDGQVSVLVNGGTTPYTYSWNTTPASSGATVTGLKIGTYTVLINDSNGCTVTDSVTIKQPPLLKLTAKETAKTCIGFNTGSAIASASGGTTPYIYTWSNAATGANASGLTNGTYIVTVTDGNGCSKDDTVDVENYPKPHITVSPDDEICIGQSVKLTASGTPFYNWTPVTTLSCNNCPNPVATPITMTQYTVVGTDSNNCMDTAAVNIDVIQKQKVSVGPPIDICAGQSAQLFADGGEAYSWSPSVGIENPNIATPNVNIDSSRKYTVVITENRCFKDTLQQSVTVHPVPTVELGPDLKGTPGSMIQLHAEVTVAKKIMWTPETGLSCYNCFDPLATLSKTITYTARVTTDYCEAKDDITIWVACDAGLFFIPNTFTPNNDGMNDKFFPSASGISNVDIFRVYNRWGEKVFEATNFAPNNPDMGWDGTFRGVPEKPDVFVYYIESKCGNGERIFLKGDISLIR